MRYDMIAEYENEIHDVIKFNRVFIFIMFDFNNLHTINRDGSYDAGDIYILNTINIMMNKFKIFNFYKIGGDEFVMIGRSDTYSEIVSDMKKIKEIEFGSILIKQTNHQPLNIAIKKVDRMITRKKNKNKKRRRDDA